MPSTGHPFQGTAAASPPQNSYPTESNSAIANSSTLSAPPEGSFHAAALAEAQALAASGGFDAYPDAFSPANPALARNQMQPQPQQQASAGPPVDPTQTVARLSSPWTTDEHQSKCTSCRGDFHHLNRRHHCRLCGRIFCHDCSNQKALIPPSSIVLVPKGGKKVSEEERSKLAGLDGTGFIGFEREADPDRMLTYLKSPEANNAGRPADRAAGGSVVEGVVAGTPGGASSNVAEDTLLYGRGLEERAKLAREPLRVCHDCHAALAPVQAELRSCNANAMRYNAIDPTDVRRLFNSPLAFTLGHEVRKAAYTLNNLLPMAKRLGALQVTSQPVQTFEGLGRDSGGGGGSNPYTNAYSGGPDVEQCKDTCQALGGNISNLDGVRIPARLVERAKGLAVMTVVKTGLGLAGFEFGTGLVVARLGDGRGWSPPCAIGMGGLAWGALIGAQITDHVFLLMDDNAVNLFSSNDGSFQLGADVGVAVGPVGRAAEADFGTTASAGSGGIAMAPIYTYSLSKGLYAGVSLDGKVIVTRHNVNEKFYGQQISASELLGGEVPTPPAAQPLYDALKRCHVYATSGVTNNGSALDNMCMPSQAARAEAFVREAGLFGASDGNFMY